MNGVAWNESEIKWRLPYFATAEDYESWERIMLQGCYRCDTYCQLDADLRLYLAVRCVDKEVANWWKKEIREKDNNYPTSFDFTKFLRVCFVTSRRMVHSAKAKVNVVQPPRVVK